jgi:hypothetical protein
MTFLSRHQSSRSQRSMPHDKWLYQPRKLPYHSYAFNNNSNSGIRHNKTQFLWNSEEMQFDIKL